MQLSDSFVRSVQPQLSPRIISDGTGGLALLIQAKRTDGKDAAKTFIWRGRINGKIKKITIGRAEVMKCTAARTEAFKISNAVKEGRDPWTERRDAKAALKAEKQPEEKKLTVKQAFTLYMVIKATRKSADEMWRQFIKDVEPVIGNTAIVAVTSDDLARIVNDVGKRAGTAGDRLQALLSPFFKWASGSRGRLDTGLKANPMLGVEKPCGVTNKRERFFSEREIRWFLTAVRQLAVEPRQKGKKDQATRRWCVGLEVLLRTGQRKMDVLNLVDSELDYEAHTATVPGERHKSGRDHVVWLVPVVEGLLQSVDRPEVDGRKPNSQRLFQRLGSVDTNLDRVRVRMAALAAQEGHKVDHWTIHDLRRSMASTIADMVDEDERPIASTDEIKKVVGHVLQGAIAHYLHGQAIPLKRRVMRVWNEYLDGLIDVQPVKLAA